jgi:hypothetical protein
MQTFMLHAAHVSQSCHLTLCTSPAGREADRHVHALVGQRQFRGPATAPAQFHRVDK